jgi:23S rRNA pseudouridine1911/1915/1917 synthase
MSSAEPEIDIAVPPEHEGARFDWFVALQFPQYSRVNLRRMINAAALHVNGKRQKAAHRLKAGDRISGTLPNLPREGPEPENIPLEILYEDDVLAVVNKPPGMVVHPARGHWSGTLTSALQYHFDQLSGAGGATRPGIVHRLDRDTSGVIVIAKNDPTHMALAEQFERREVEKEYFAIVRGVPECDRDVIDLPIGTHPYSREKMAIRRDHTTSKSAQTFYEVQERFEGFAALKILPKTGRTHQIRLHLAHIGCPVLCDKLYGGRSQITRGEITRDPSDEMVMLARQALHARRLKFAHPCHGGAVESTASLPPDILAVLTELRISRRKTSS